MTDTQLADLLANAGLTAVGPAIYPAGSHVLTVGVGKQYATVAAAVGASRDGDVLLIDAGTYTNDFATVRAKITMIGVGGMVNMVATVPPPNWKGILTVDNDATIQNMSFSGCAIPASYGGNGAGIRYEGGKLVLVNDAFIGNQNGIMGNPVLPGLTNTITIDHSLFSGNGSGTGRTHNLYIGAVDSLTATNSVFEGAIVGHQFKSRALANDIENNVFRDGPKGTASYEIDLPNGGVGTVLNNYLEKGPLAQNLSMIHFGGEGIPYANSSLLVQGNTFVNDQSGSATAVLNHTSISVTVTGNFLQNISPKRIASGPAVLTSNADQHGVPVSNTTQVGVIPGSTQVFVDSADHSVTLDGFVNKAVQGGAGHLTVSAVGGHVLALGGYGGMDFTESLGSGGNTVSTKAGSVNTLTLHGQDSIDSQGTDRIIAGEGNVNGQIGGVATVDDGTGNDEWNVLGTATIVGHGANPVVKVGPKGHADITGNVGYLDVQNNGGTSSFDIMLGSAHLSAAITGGALEMRTFAGQMNFTTAAGTQGTTLHLGEGKAVVLSRGHDVIWAGAGDAIVQMATQAEVHAGTGALAVYGKGIEGEFANFYGNGGSYLIDGNGGHITYYGGDLASTVQANLTSIKLIGGAGHLTVNGGMCETITGGSGGLTLDASGGGGGDRVTTAAGSTNTINLGSSGYLDSWGHDTIVSGTGNQTLIIHGDAVVGGSTGDSKMTFSGNDTLNGHGNDGVTVTAGANAVINAGLTAIVRESAATVAFAATGHYAGTAVLTGGSGTIAGGLNRALAVVTDTFNSTDVALGAGSFTVTTRGADVVHGGSGASNIVITWANTQVWGGAGALTIRSNDFTAGDVQTIHGGAGSISYLNSNSALSFIGGSGSAVINGQSGSLNVVGGSGTLSVTGGAAGLRFIAGSGNASVGVSGYGGAEITFGTGNTNVQLIGGRATMFDLVAGTGGGTDMIKGFRVGTDKLMLQGVGVQSHGTVGGSANLLLTDGTHLTLTGVADSARLFG